MGDPGQFFAWSVSETKGLELDRHKAKRESFRFPVGG
jgi:hypothetical protein